jgi:VanZ family protein
MHFSTLTLSCLGLTAGVFAACLWPYNFTEANRVSVRPGGGGIRFEAPAMPQRQHPGGIVFTADGLRCRSNPSCERGVVSIEIRLKAETENSGCLKRIVDLRTPDGSEGSYIGQWESSFIVRAFALRPAGGKPYQEIGIAHALAAGRESCVTVSSGPEGTVIYLDGRPAKQFPGVSLLKESDSLHGHKLYFGNSPALDCPWAGDLYGFAVYGRAIGPDEAEESFRRWEGSQAFGEGDRAQTAVAGYRFDEISAERIEDLSDSGNDLTASPRLIFEKPVLHLPRLSDLHAADVMLNVAGFIPLGLSFAFRQFRAGKQSLRTSAAAAILMGAALSVAVEVIQAWLPTRDSSLADFIANAAGAGLGAAAFIAWARCLQRSRRGL